MGHTRRAHPSYKAFPLRTSTGTQQPVNWYNPPARFPLCHRAQGSWPLPVQQLHSVVGHGNGTKCVSHHAHISGRNTWPWGRRCSAAQHGICSASAGSYSCCIFPFLLLLCHCRRPSAAAPAPMAGGGPYTVFDSTRHIQPVKAFEGHVVLLHSNNLEVTWQAAADCPQADTAHVSTTTLWATPIHANMRHSGIRYFSKPTSQNACCQNRIYSPMFVFWGNKHVAMLQRSQQIFTN